MPCAASYLLWALHVLLEKRTVAWNTAGVLILPLPAQGNRRSLTPTLLMPMHFLIATLAKNQLLHTLAANNVPCMNWSHAF